MNILKHKTLLTNIISEIIMKCPECSEKMESGFIGPPGWLKWFPNKEKVYTTFGVILSGKRLVSGIVKNTPAQRCNNCGTVIFKGKPGVL